MASTHMDRCTLTAVPLEIFNNIVLELANLEPLGPPSIINPLMQTCRTIYNLLLPDNNPALFGGIFCSKFDTAAITRRAFSPTPARCTAQLLRVLAAMRVFRSGDIYSSDFVDDDAYLGLPEALEVALIMMLEDDGRNAAQLILWAKADVFVKDLVTRRLFEGSDLNEGFPIESCTVSCALWVWWLLTSEESLLKETYEERLEIQKLLLGFVYHPVRYAVTFAPPNHFILPTELVNTVDTPHGPYPITHEPGTIRNVHFDARIQLASLPAAAAAKLLFLARHEVMPIPTLKNTTMYDIREELEEFNWGWGAYPPLGTGLRTRSGALKNVEGWSGREWTQEDQRDEMQEPYPQRLPVVEPPGVDVPTPDPKWIGKAPHPGTSGPGTSKSRNWDADWWRMRMCTDFYRDTPRVPYGNTYEPGSFEGLWQGSMLIPPISDLRELLDNPNLPPPDIFVEVTKQSKIDPIFVRLRELHGIEGEVGQFPDKDGDHNDSHLPFGIGSPEEHYGMMNGWFTGNQVPEILPGKLGKVRVRVGKETAMYRRCKPDQGASRLGNDAYTISELETGEEGSTDRARIATEDVRYEHDAAACGKCRDRRNFRRLLRSVQTFKSIYDVNLNEYEEHLLKPWDLEDALFPDTYLDPQGRPMGSQPAAHDWDRRGRGQCDGIRDIIVVGEPDPQHARAFGAYIFYGRVRRWDGAIVLVRTGRDNPDLGIMVFYGNIIGGNTIVGKWRWGGTDPGVPGLESTFSLARRLD